MLFRPLIWIVFASGCDRVFGIELRDAGSGAEGSGGEAGAVDAPRAPCVFTTDRFVVPAYWWVPNPYVSNDCTALFFTGGGDARSAH